MTATTRPQPAARFFGGGGAESPAVPLPLAADAIGLPADLLDGGEAVILAIKPSPWFVLFDSVHLLLFGAILIAGAPWIGGQSTIFSPGALIQIGLTLAGVRLGMAVLRWVSRTYVLTNRRVMRIRGVLRADIYACPLLKVRNTLVTVSPQESLTGLGTILFATEEGDPGDGAWRQLARPHEVHAKVRKAIEQAIDSQPHI